MGSGIFFPICAIPFSLLLIILFFRKKSLKNDETQIYKVLIILNFIGLILELLCTVGSLIYNTFPLISNIIFKSYLVYLLLWTGLLFYYLYCITEKNNSDNKTFRLVLYLLAILVVIAIYSLPIELVIKNNFEVRYTTGLSVNFTYAVSAIITMGMVFLLIKNHKIVKNKKFIPVFTFLIVGAIAIMLQNAFPELLMITYVETLICTIMYFTIENPDLKMIEELSKTKELSENTNDEKSKFLFEVTNYIDDKLTKIEKIYNDVNGLNPQNDIKDEMLDLKDIIDNARIKLKQTIDVSELDTRHLLNINNKYDIKLLLNTVFLQNKANVNPSIDYRLNINEGLPIELYGDSIKVKQIISTLLANSIKYTEKGFIELRVNSIIKYDVCRLIISVEDSGCGIDLKMQNEILNNHADLTEDEIANKSNMDLNLKMIRKIVNLIGGSLTIESKDYSGTKIMVILDQKIVEVKKNEEEKQIEKYSLEVKNRIKIATISMDNQLRNELKKLIKKYDFLLDEFGVTLDCLTKIRNDYKYDVIIIEENMEKIDAISFKRKLKNEGYNPKVWVITNSNDIRKKKELFDDGFEDVIVNPIVTEEFRKKLDLLKKD